MRIAIASDFHFGYAWGTERAEDSFIQGKEAIEKSLAADAIILPGDIFDSRVPKQEIIGRAMHIVGLASLSPSSAIIEKAIPERALPKLHGTPVIAIHGNHERRASGLTNPVQLLEAAGLCVVLHGNAVVLRKGEERVAIHGMGGVPEQYAPLALKECGFKPLPGMANILVLHQGFREHVYGEMAYLSMDDLPPGFDLYVNGHIHLSGIREKGGKILFHPGSTILTQMKKAEAKQPKRIWIYDSATGGLQPEELATPRKFYYVEINAAGSASAVAEQAAGRLSKIPASARKPLVKLRITGTLAPGASINAKAIALQFPGLMLSVDNEAESKQFKRRVELLREGHSKKSVDELGLSILQKNLEQANYDGPEAYKLLQLLVEGKQDEAAKLIFGEYPS